MTTLRDDAIEDSSKHIPLDDDTDGPVFDDSIFGSPAPDNGSSLFGDDEEYDEPDAAFFAEKKRSAKAKLNEKKMRDLFRMLTLLTVTNERTVADSAALALHGDGMAVAIGDLAAESKWVESAVDFIAGGTDNATTAALLTVLPFAMQIVRNHESEIEPEAYRELRVPFTKRTVKVKFRLRLRRGRQFTQDPVTLTQYVYTRPEIVAALQKRGITPPVPAQAKRSKK